MYKIWVDEAWRWPWAWPVVACSLCFSLKNKPSKEFLKKINDSKKITEKNREKIFEELIKLSNLDNPQIYFWVWVVDNFLIDEINIRQANREAMRRSLVELFRKINIPFDSKNIEISIDWKDNYDFEWLHKRPEFIVGWDGKVLEIWAASIIAKVFRDKLMDTYSLLYPEINFSNHKWYWTKAHMNYLSDITKVTWIHRISYKPIKKLFEE